MRGETQRVAERVRELLDPARHEDEDELVPGDVESSAAGGREPVAARAAPALLERLAARVPVRLDPGHRAAIGVGVAVLVVAVLVGFWLWSSGPRTAAVASGGVATPIAGARAPEGSAASSGSPAAPGSVASTPSRATSALVVDVAGKVAHPGLYRLAVGSRVADALAAAGGARRGVDLTPINLAAPVADGQQIVVGGAAVQGGTAPAAGSTPGTAGATATVDLNTATLDQLETLPGIGPALGQRILDYRSAHGSFTTVDQLNDVSGIGDVRFAQLRPLVTV